MPRTAAQLETIRAESRARIIGVALDLFARQGYESTSVRQIAEAAHIAQGLLYNYFDGKEGLLRAIFEQCLVDVRRSFAGSTEPQSRGPLEGIIRASFRILRQNLAFWRLSYSLRTQPAVLGSLGDDVLAWSSEIRTTLETYYAASGSLQPALDAAILFATIDGIAQHYALDPNGYPIDAVIERLVERFC